MADEARQQTEYVILTRPGQDEHDDQVAQRVWHEHSQPIEATSSDAAARKFIETRGDANHDAVTIVAVPTRSFQSKVASITRKTSVQLDG